MFHQIRQPIRARDIRGPQAEQMMFHRAMRAHRTPRGSGATRRQVNLTLCPRHQAAQPKPKGKPRRIGFRPAARRSQGRNRGPAIARRTGAGASGFLRFPGGAEEMAFGRGNAPARAAPGFRQ
jgi:hypothetical protein